MAKLERFAFLLGAIHEAKNIPLLDYIESHFQVRRNIPNVVTLALLQAVSPRVPSYINSSGTIISSTDKMSWGFGFIVRAKCENDNGGNYLSNLLQKDHREWKETLQTYDTLHYLVQMLLLDRITYPCNILQGGDSSSIDCKSRFGIEAGIVAIKQIRLILSENYGIKNHDDKFKIDVILHRIREHSEYSRDMHLCLLVLSASQPVFQSKSISMAKSVGNAIVFILVYMILQEDCDVLMDIFDFENNKEWPSVTQEDGLIDDEEFRFKCSAYGLQHWYHGGKSDSKWNKLIELTKNLPSRKKNLCTKLFNSAKNVFADLAPQ